MVAIFPLDGHQDVAVARVFSGIHDYWEALCKRYDDSTEAADVLRKRAETETKTTAKTTAKTTTRTTAQATAKTTAKTSAKTTATAKATTPAHVQDTKSTVVGGSSPKTTTSASSGTKTSDRSSTLTAAPTSLGSWVPAYSVIAGETVSAYINSAGRVVSIAYVGTDGRMTIMPYTADGSTVAVTGTPTTTTGATVSTSTSTSTSASSTASAAATTTNSDSKSSHVGMIVGIVVALVAVFILIFVFFRYRRSRLLRPLFKNLNEQPFPTGHGNQNPATSRDSLLDPETAAASKGRDVEKQQFEKQLEAQTPIPSTGPSVSAAGAATQATSTPASSSNGQQQHSRSASSTTSRPTWPMPPRAPSSLDSYSTFPPLQNKRNSGGNGNIESITTPLSARPARRSTGPPTIQIYQPQSQYAAAVMNSAPWNQKRVPLSPLPASPTSIGPAHVASAVDRQDLHDLRDSNYGRCASYMSLGGLSIASSAVVSPSMLPWPMPPASVSTDGSDGSRDGSRNGSRAGSCSNSTSAPLLALASPGRGSLVTVSRSTAAYTNLTAVTTVTPPGTSHSIPRKPLAATAQTTTRAAVDGPGSRNLLQEQASKRRSSLRQSMDVATSPPPKQAPPPPPGMAPRRGSGLEFTRDENSMMVRVPISRFHSPRGVAADGRT